MMNLRARRRCFLPQALALALSCLGSHSHAEPVPALSFHVVQAGLGKDCTVTVMGTGRCQNIVLEGTPGAAQRVYVVASNVEALGGTRFGIAYGPDIFVESWTSCVDGLELATDTWPAAGSAIALTADVPVPPVGQDEMVIIGHFTLSAPSLGVFALTPDPRSGSAQYVTASLETHEFDPVALGRVDLSGTGLGFSACGTEKIPDPLEPGGGGPCDEPVDVTPDPSSPGVDSTFVCGTNTPQLAIEGSDEWWNRDGEESVTAVLAASVVPGGTNETFVLSQDGGSLRVAKWPSSFNTSPLWGHSYNDEADDLFLVETPDFRRNLVVPRSDLVFIAGEGHPAFGGSGRQAFVGRVFANGDNTLVWKRYYHNATVDGEEYVAGIAATADRVLVAGHSSDFAGGVHELFVASYAAIDGEPAGQATLGFLVDGDPMVSTDMVLDGPRGRLYIATQSASTSTPCSRCTAAPSDPRTTA